MILFGHLGIGNTLVKPFRRGLPLKWVLFGTIFPDILDKALYYGLVLLTGRYGADIGPICGTRTFGHSALFLLLLSLGAFLAKSRIIAALSLGMATHLLLDGIGDYYSTMVLGTPHESALLWGISQWSFPAATYHSIFEHLSSSTHPFLIFSELAGLLLLGWDFWLRANRQQILTYFHKRKFLLKHRLKHRRFQS
jgi:hypothetical protein